MNEGSVMSVSVFVLYLLRHGMTSRFSVPFRIRLCFKQLPRAADVHAFMTRRDYALFFQNRIRDITLQSLS